MSNKGIGAAKPRKGGNNDSAKLEEVIQLLHFKDHADEWVRIRLLERGLLAVKRHWCKIIAGKEKKAISVPRFCVTFNPNNESEPLEGTCPYCNAMTEDRETSPVTAEFFYLMNAIIRDIQEDEPSRKAELTSKEKKTGFKDIKSKSWTPVRVVRLTNTVVARIQELGETNIVKPKKKGDKKDKKAKGQAYDLSHPKYGVDINIKFKPKAAGSDKYSVDKADDGRCALTEEELEYLVWDLSEGLLDLCGRMTEKQAKEDFKRMELNGGDEIDDDDEDDDDDIPLGKKKKGKKDKKKGRNAFDDDDEDEDEDDDKPSKKKKKDKSSGKKKKSSSLDDDDDDEDEDDVPKKKKKDKSSDKKKKSKSKSKFDDDDEDDDEDDTPKKKKSKDKKSKDVKKKKKPSRDDDDDDDDEDDEPKKKKKKDKSSDKKKGKKSSKKSKIDDDDDEW